MSQPVSSVNESYAKVFATLDYSETDDFVYDRTQRIVLKTKAQRTQRGGHQALNTLPDLDVGDDPASHFRLGPVLGEGGRGVVHLASQTALSRDVAIKSTKGKPKHTAVNEELLLEARAMGFVEHPNVVPVHLIGKDDEGQPVIVMKRVRGQAWSDWIGKQPENEDALEFHLRAFTGVCRAVAYAHSKGIVHRDIKPDNVMLGTFGETYLLDWGLAATVSAAVTHLPAVDQIEGVAGTPAYMAPEMTEGMGSKLSLKTDIFLLGATLYHVLTGQPPNRGQTLFGILSFSYTGAKRSYPDKCPDELRAICERAMAYRADDRYATADELRIAIQDFQKHRSSYELAQSAKEKFRQLPSLNGDELQNSFAEVRFGYASAIQIWADNRVAQSGLEEAVRWMVQRELEDGNAAVARRVLVQSGLSLPALLEQVEHVAHRRAAERKKLNKIAFDYDENIGNRSRRLLIAFMAITFALTPWILEVFEGAIVPSYLSWISDNAFLLAANAVGVLFAPALIAAAYYTYRNLWAHKTSRVFVKSLTAMFLIGMLMRAFSLSDEVTLKYAAAAECSVYAVGLTILGLAIDRRLGPPSFFYGLTALTLAFTDLPELYVYAFGSVVACLSFLMSDRLPDRGLDSND
ncbi:MAG: serine/threonine-protein kinase [Bradymonadia bacterium]